MAFVTAHIRSPLIVECAPQQSRWARFVVARPSSYELVATEGPATGAAAAAVLSPYLTAIGAPEVYVDTNTLVGLEAAASEVGLRPIEGGRLTLRPMPTQGVRRLATEVGGLRVAPWPRVFVDLRTVGVRGEEAAEHLWEVMHGKGA